MADFNADVMKENGFDVVSTADKATQPETDAGTSDDKYITPLKLANSDLAVASAEYAGQVKVNDGNGTKFSHTFTGGGGGDTGTFVQLTYATPLGLSSSPTTTWPSNIASPTDADIYDSVNDTFIENTVLGQVHLWRVIVQYSGKSAGQSIGTVVKLENTLSGFTEEVVQTAPSDTTSGTMTFLLTTIADSASLPAPFGTGQGYELSVTAYDPMTVVVDSVTRISNAH